MGCCGLPEVCVPQVYFPRVCCKAAVCFVQFTRAGYKPVLCVRRQFLFGTATTDSGLSCVAGGWISSSLNNGN